MSRTWNKAAGAVTLVLVGVLASGCVNVIMESDFSSDTVTHSLESTIDRESLDQLNQLGPTTSEQFTDQERNQQQAAQFGLQYEPVDTDEVIGGRFTLSLPNIQATTQLGNVLNQLFTDSSEASNTEGTPIVPQTAFTGSYTKDGDTYRLELNVDSDMLFAQTGVDQSQAPVPMDQIITTFRYTVRMPGEIDETNGQRLDDGRVQWDIPVTGVNNLTATSRVAGDDSDSILLIAGIIGGVLVVAALVVGYIVLGRRRAVPAAATAVPAPVMPPPPADAPGAPQPETLGGSTVATPSEGPDADTRQFPPREEPT